MADELKVVWLWILAYVHYFFINVVNDQFADHDDVDYLFFWNGRPMEAC